MSGKVPGVTTKFEIEDVKELPSTEELPERLQEAAVLYHEMGHEWFELVSRKAPVLRSDGYQLPTLLLFFIALFTAEFRPSIRYVCEALARQKNRLLAACCGFIGFPTQASVSRFLKSVRQDRLEEVMGWMLVFSHHTARRLMRHAGCACRDTFGAPWHLFDLDPTSTVVRRRALPENEELPPPLRRYAELTGAGYTGRKRGEALFRRIVLQHVGSSLWLGSWLRYAGTKTRETFAAAIDMVVECCEFVGFDRANAILRVDGEGGNVPMMTACINAGIGYVMRGTHYSILERADVRQQLLSGQWYEVDDSGSGPRRLAVDLGEIEISASPETVDDEGKPYPPIKSRVIVTRFEATEKCSSGVFIEDALYELFVTNLPAAAWPASEIVTLYYHRATQENRFGREDKELSLDTVFSQTPQGQSLATLIGLLVWNLRVLLGFEAADDEDELNENALTSASAREIRPASPPVHRADERPETKTATTDNLHEVNVWSPDPEGLNQLRLLILETIEQGCHTLNKDSFYWEKEHGLRCPDGHLFEFSTVRTLGGNQYLIMLAPYAACGGCKLRHLCSRSTAANFRKERAIRLKSAAAAKLRELLERYKQLQIQHALSARKQRAPVPRPKSPLSTQLIDPQYEPYLPNAAGPHKMILPRLNPAALKRRFFTGVLALSIVVSPDKEPPKQSPSPYFYRSAADRARRRRTWVQRLSHNRRTRSVHIRLFRASAAQSLFSTAKIKAES